MKETTRLPSLKIDLHVHTVNSYDGHTRIEDIPQLIRNKGLDGVAITEHDKYQSLEMPDALVLPAIEISTTDGHIIGVGVHEAIPSRLPADETIQKIHEQGGVAIVPHPYDPVCECVKIARLRIRPDAVETMNADALSFHVSNWLARRDAHKFGLPQVAGSDSHIPQTLGDAYTVIESATLRIADILEAIKRGRVKPEGHATSIANKLRKVSHKFT